jgi:hypothetical protein
VGFTTTAQLPHPGQAEPTTQLTRAVCYDIGWPWQEDQKGEHRSVRMNWVVVTDENGSRQVPHVLACGSGPSGVPDPRAVTLC